MSDANERRREKRLRYNWPVWFAEDFTDILSQGQMVDISSKGAAFTCYADNCPQSGEHITARFSVPRFDHDDSFDLESFIRDGHICRVDDLSPFVRRVAIQFAEPLPFKPGQVTDSEALNTTDTINMQSADSRTDELARNEARAMAAPQGPVETPESVGTERAHSA